MTTAPKHRAFLSYSHADEAMARYLHARLERYTIDPAIVPGAAKGKLAPVFLDRMGFSGGRPLTHETIEKLDDCAALILLASPASAASKPVREEVETFQARHPERPIIPVILSGSAATVFPPSLPTETLAVDWNKDNAGLFLPHRWAAWLDRTWAWRVPRWLGWGDLAFAKLVAGLLGVEDPDSIFRREKRRTRQVVTLIALAVLVFAGLSLRLASSEFDKQAARREVSALTAKLRLFDPAYAQAPNRADGLESAVFDLRTRAQSDPDAARIYDLLKAGKPAEAADAWDRWLALQEERDRDIRRHVDKDRAQQHRELAAIRRLTDPRRALGDYARSVELDPENEDGLEWAAELAIQVSDYPAAAKYYTLIARLPAAAKDGDAAWQAKNGLGDVLVAQGKLPEALKSYTESRAIAERLAQADPGNAGWQRDLSVSHDNLGDVLVAQGNLTEALTAYRASLAIRERLAQADPGNAGWQRDLSVSHDNLGDVLVAQGNLTEALTAYRASLAIAERLAQADPGNAGWQHDLGQAHAFLVYVHRKLAQIPEAREHLVAGRAILVDLVAKHPEFAQWKKDLAWFDGQLAALK